LIELSILPETGSGVLESRLVAELRPIPGAGAGELVRRA